MWRRALFITAAVFIMIMRYLFTTITPGCLYLFMIAILLTFCFSARGIANLMAIREIEHAVHGMIDLDHDAEHREQNNIAHRPFLDPLEDDVPVAEDRIEAPERRRRFQAAELRPRIWGRALFITAAVLIMIMRYLFTTITPGCLYLFMNAILLSFCFSPRGVANLLAIRQGERAAHGMIDLDHDAEQREQNNIGHRPFLVPFEDDVPVAEDRIEALVRRRRFQAAELRPRFVLFDDFVFDAEEEEERQNP